MSISHLMSQIQEGSFLDKDNEWFMFLIYLCALHELPSICPNKEFKYLKKLEIYKSDELLHCFLYEMADILSNATGTFSTLHLK